MKIPTEEHEFNTVLQRLLESKGYLTTSALISSSELGVYGETTKEAWYQFCNDTPNCSGDALSAPNVTGPDWLHNMMAEFVSENFIAVVSSNKPTGFTESDRVMAASRLNQSAQKKERAQVSEAAKAKAIEMLRGMRAKSEAKAEEFNSINLSGKTKK